MADASRQLRLYNTLTRTKKDFVPIDPDNVRMYVCGPTVYDYAHIGNARPAIVFDVLFRLLRHLYGADHVTYVRNITDVDDKINARALRDFGGEIGAGRLSLNEAIRKVTEPTFEPRATEFVLPRADGKADMVGLIQALIDSGHAYEAKGESGREVLFDTTSMPDYGQLAKRNLDEQQAGARVAVEAHKKHPADFVLWKESSAEEPGWEASFKVGGKASSIRGRPGWHIECSAMSAAYLGEVFDIHGGGLDLIFPHHENEIAQSRCAHGSQVMANVWMHNGFLQVEGRKMSKSEGNFVTIHELLKDWPGEVVRLNMLRTHYRQPIDWTLRSLEESFQKWAMFRDVVRDFVAEPSVDTELLNSLVDDLNTPLAVSRLYRLLDESGDSLTSGRALVGSLRLLGFFTASYPVRLSLYYPLPLSDVGFGSLLRENLNLSGDVELTAIAERLANTNGRDADHLVHRLLQFAPGTAMRDVRRLIEAGAELDAIATESDRRLALLRDKNFAEADKIRDELLAQGIQLKDGKDPETGERVTTWEVKR